MDTNAVNFNLTVDDFDSVISYASQSAWTTPNPQLSLPFNQSATPWREGTYHSTDVVNASFTFDFQGPAIYIYGASGPAFGHYQISIDGNTSSSSAYATLNSSSFPLFGTSNLTYDNHTLTVTNLGAKEGANEGNQLLFDYLLTTVQLGPSGATLVNTTVQETDSNLVYTGNWTTNVYNPAFSGGGSKYTNADGATVSLSFHGCSIFIFGDKVDDHGLFSVTLDNSPAQQFDGVSGCGGEFHKFCEKTNTLAYFASNLDESLHTVMIRNNAGVNNSFFDLDSMVYTTPSTYSVRQPATSNSSGSTGGSSPSSSGTTNKAFSSYEHHNITCLLLVFGALSLWRSLHH